MICYCVKIIYVGRVESWEFQINILSNNMYSLHIYNILFTSPNQEPFISLTKILVMQNFRSSARDIIGVSLLYFQMDMLKNLHVIDLEVTTCVSTTIIYRLLWSIQKVEITCVSHDLACFLVKFFHIPTYIQVLYCLQQLFIEISSLVLAVL